MKRQTKEHTYDFIDVNANADVTVWGYIHNQNKYLWATTTKKMFIHDIKGNQSDTST